MFEVPEINQNHSTSKKEKRKKNQKYFFTYWQDLSQGGVWINN